MYDESEKAHALVCTEVWGGNRKVSRSIKLPSLMAWVASNPINDDAGGGDLHYMSVCDHDLISRVALADVSGHGHDVSAVTQTLRELMHKNINLLDQSDFMRGLNDAFNKSKKYATAIILSFHRVTGRLAFSNAGHLPPLCYHAAQRNWGWPEEGKDPQLKRLAGLPVGVNSWNGLQSDGGHSQTVRYSCAIHRWHYRNRKRDEPATGARAASRVGAQGPRGFCESIGRRLAPSTGVVRGRLRNDDETLLALQRDEESRLVVLGEVASSYMLGRLRRSLKLNRYLQQAPLER
jgi:hypothetical protein